MILTDNLRGVLLMCVAMTAFTVNDAFMKAATADFPVIQAIALRGGLTTAALAVIGWRMGALTFLMQRADWFWIALRTVGEVGGTFAFLIALKHMPLANLSAILQALPLAVTLAAAMLLRERVGWRRMTAILVGFAGVMLIVRPGTDGFDRWSVLGLVTVGFVVLRDLATRRIAGHVPSVTVAFLAALSVALSAACVLPFTEVDAVTLHHGLLIGGAAAFLIVGYLTVVMTMRVGDVALVAPFRYTSLVAAIILGWSVFGQFPDAYTLAGSVIVVLTGIYTFHREQKRARGGGGAGQVAASAD